MISGEFMDNKLAIKTIYCELQGYLTHAPVNDKTSSIHDPAFWEQYNSSIAELNKVTGKDYNKFILTPRRGGGESHYLYLEKDTYRQKLSGLIAHLYGEYFSDEVAPFKEMPSTIITQSQNQNQSVHVQMILEVSDLIHDKLSKVQEGSKEKTFLEKIKSSLSTVKDVGQLISLIMATAHELSIPIQELAKLFR
jgi:hypothetical protein